MPFAPTLMSLKKRQNSQNICEFLIHAVINKDLNQRREKEWKSDFCFEAVNNRARSDKGVERGGGLSSLHPTQVLLEPQKCLRSESHCLTLKCFNHGFMVESLDLASPLASSCTFGCCGAHHAKWHCRSLFWPNHGFGPSYPHKDKFPMDNLLWRRPKQLQPEQGLKNKSLEAISVTIPLLLLEVSWLTKTPDGGVCIPSSHWTTCRSL